MDVHSNQRYNHYKSLCSCYFMFISIFVCLVVDNWIEFDYSTCLFYLTYDRSYIGSHKELRQTDIINNFFFLAISARLK